MIEALQRLVHSERFQHFVTAVILLAAVLVGLETYPGFVARYGTVLHLLDQLIVGIIVAEIVMKMGAEGARPWRYFRDPWNVFDFLIVAAVFLPFDGQYVTVLRLARLLRVLRLVHSVPRLQVLVSALLKAIPSMGYVSILLFLVFYVYAVAGVFLFGKNDPFRFGELPTAIVTLFQVATAEEWVQTLNIQRYGCDQFGYEDQPTLCKQPTAYPVVAPLYFISFILLGTMIILNLFIGVIMGSIEEAENERDEREERTRSAQRSPAERRALLEDDLKNLERQIAQLSESVRTISVRAKLSDKDANPS